LLAERAAANAAQVEAAYGGKPVSAEDASGSDSEEDPIQEEYENEEQVATVTVVEDFDIDTLVPAGAPSDPIPDPSNQDQDQSRRSEHRAKVPKPNAAPKTPATPRRKTSSAKKIKYETKAARVAEKRKQRTRKHEKAARAGGKQSHSSKKRK
jgi:ribosomal RNA-processing protein 17